MFIIIGILIILKYWLSYLKEYTIKCFGIIDDPNKKIQMLFKSYRSFIPEMLKLEISFLADPGSQEYQKTTWNIYLELLEGECSDYLKYPDLTLSESGEYKAVILVYWGDSIAIEEFNAYIEYGFTQEIKTLEGLKGSINMNVLFSPNNKTFQNYSAPTKPWNELLPYHDNTNTFCLRVFDLDSYVYSIIKTPNIYIGRPYRYNIMSMSVYEDMETDPIETKLFLTEIFLCDLSIYIPDTIIILDLSFKTFIIKLWSPQGGLTYKTYYNKTGNILISSDLNERLDYLNVKVYYMNIYEALDYSEKLIAFYKTDYTKIKCSYRDEISYLETKKIDKLLVAEYSYFLEEDTSSKIRQMRNGREHEIQYCKRNGIKV